MSKDEIVKEILEILKSKKITIFEALEVCSDARMSISNSVKEERDALFKKQYK